MKNIYVIIVFFLCGCSNFLSEYSQDMVRAKTVADFDEVLLGSVYVPSNATTTTLIFTHLWMRLTRVLKQISMSG